MINDTILARIKLHTKQNPVYSAEIERQYNLSGAEVRSAIRDLRRQGEPIANSSNGYYYARDLNELQETLSDLRGRANSLLNTARLLESNFNNNTEQTLF